MINYKYYLSLNFFYCLLIPLALSVLTDLLPDWDQWYSIEDRYRAQTAALAEGHFSLGDTLGEIQHDNTWSGGGVHQVWGLGVPFLQLPFELLAKAFGFDMFPDQLILAFGLFCVTAWGYRVAVLNKGGLKAEKSGYSLGGICFSHVVALLLLLFSPVVLSGDSSVVTGFRRRHAAAPAVKLHKTKPRTERSYVRKYVSRQRKVEDCPGNKFCSYQLPLLNFAGRNSIPKSSLPAESIGSSSQGQSNRVEYIEPYIS